MIDVTFCCNTCDGRKKALEMNVYKGALEFRCECCGNYTQIATK